jgi:predicted metal-dependent phosphoesterase TrpH
MAEVDLHLHTTYSDGNLTPGDLVRLCADRGLKVVAITDHDSTEGLPEAVEAAGEFPSMRVIPGVELGTDIPGGEIHLLGYFVDYEDEEFQETMRRFRSGRVDRAKGMVDALRTLGLDVSWERVEELSGGGAIGRPHIAQAMVEAGYVQYPRDAFNKYLGRDGLAYVERPKMTPEEAVRLLVRNGAVPVMAHPTYSAVKAGMTSTDDLTETLSELKRAGLAGMEVHYGDYTDEQVEELLELACKLDLVPCGGSDYHASGNPGEPEPGSVGPPLGTVDTLESLRPSTGSRAAGR